MGNLKSKTVDGLFEEAKRELIDCQLKALKKRINAKLTDKAAAEKIVKNIVRELEDLRLQVEQELE